MIIHHQRHHQQPCHHLKFLLIPLFLFPSWPLLPATRLETQGLSLTLSLLHSPCSVAFRAELPCLLSLTVDLPAAFPAQPSLCAFYLELPTRLPSYKITSFSTSLIRKVKAKCESESCSVVSDSSQSYDYTVRGMLQARILEWVAFPFSGGSSQPRN